jgi:hypothetical protein
MEELSKDVSVEMNLRKNGRLAFSLQSVLKGYKKDKEVRLRQSSFETPA